MKNNINSLGRSKWSKL